MTAVVGSPLESSFPRTTGDMALPNSEKESHRAIEPRRSDILNSIKEKQMENIVL